MVSGKTAGESYRLTDLVDLKALQKMAEAHFKSTGIPIGLIDAYDNSVLVGAGWQDICTKFHRANAATLQRCQESDNFIKANLKRGEPCSYKCINGLWDIGMPVVVFDEHMATLFLGQFFYEGEIPDRPFFSQQAKTYHFDERAYLAALDRVPVFTREKVQMILEYDIALASFIAELAEKALQQRRSDIEREALELRLHQAEKMESIGRLAGGIAHDFNNMLGVILGQAELSMLQLEPDSTIYNDLVKIHAAAKHSAELTRQLLAFARKQVVKPRVVNLTEIIDNMHNVLCRMIGENIELNWQPEPDLWPVWIDPVQIDQLLANLCSNSRDAIEGFGTITLEAKNCIVNSPHFAGTDELPPGDYVKLSVADTGHGMELATKEHIFEPFFTTKLPGQGTGLGLATVYGIVTQNKGFITVYSEPGKGTIFSIYLPRYQGEAVAIVDKEVKDETPRGQEQILLVEDDREILALTRSMLESLGYEVLATCEPDSAIELARRQKSPIDLLLTDVVMPKMNGPDLAEEIQRIYPGCKVVFMSGYTDDMIVKQGVLKSGLHFIQKPYSISELGSCLREALISS